MVDINAITTPGISGMASVIQRVKIQLGAIILPGLEKDDALSESTSLTDFCFDIMAFLSEVGDACMDVSAGYQAMESCPIDIQTLGESICDNILDIAVGFLGIIDMPISVILSRKINMDVIMDIMLSSGIITRDMAMDISVGDGSKIISMGMDLMAVYAMPEFKYVYAMSLNSVIKEVA